MAANADQPRAKARDPRLEAQDAVMMAPGRCEFKAIVLALFLHLNAATWSCTTSVKTLAAYAGLDPKTARKKLAALVACGGISRRDRVSANGDQDSPEWTIHRARIVAAVTEASEDEPKRCPPARGGRAVVGGTSVDDGTSADRPTGTTNDDPTGTAVVGTGGRVVNGTRTGVLQPESKPEKKTDLFASATADAVIDPDPVGSQKPKRRTSKASKDKPPPHPFNQRVIDAWDRCWKATHNDERYPWGKSDVPTLVTCVRDPHVSRDEVRGAADMQRVGAAMKRYLSQRVDGTYVKGLSVRGFCGDVAKWMTPVDTSHTPSPRPSATPFVSIADMIASRQSTQPPTRSGVVIDIEEPN